MLKRIGSKKLLIIGGLSVAIIAGSIFAYTIFSQKNSTIKTQEVVKVNFERTQGKDGAIVISFLAKNYGFTLNGGFPSLKCYEKNPLDASSGKIGYVLCDENAYGGGYFSAMWRDTSKEISVLQSAILKDILKSKSASVTLGASSLYTEKMFICKKDNSFKDTVTGMNGMFVDCTLSVDKGVLPLYVSFFYFSSEEKMQYRNVLVFSNVGTRKNTIEKDFTLSARQRIKFLKKVDMKNVSVGNSIYFFEHAYAGGGGTTGGGGGGSEGVSENGSDPTPPSDPISSLVSYISQTYGSPSESAMNAINNGGNGFSIGGTQSDTVGMTSIGYNQYCCTTNGYAITINPSGSGSGSTGNAGALNVTQVPGVLFSSSPSSVTWNTATTLTWSTAAADSCTASGAWSGSVPLNGPQTSPLLTSPSTFNLYCSNAIGNSPTVSTSVNVCPEGSPTWDGSTCQMPTGTLTSNSCTIPLGSGSCAMNVTWNTQYPSGIPEVRRPYAGNSVLASGISGNGSYVFPYQAAPYTLELYDRTVKLDSASFVSHCIIGGFDSTSGACVNPMVDSVIVTGQYYSTPGNIALTCLNSDRYKVLKEGVLFKSGAYLSTVNVPVTDSANYSIICIQGSYDSLPVVKYYNSPPPPTPVISITSSPRTIPKNVDSALSWSVQFPVPSCKLTAKVVCTNDACTAEQKSAETVLNAKIASENTDTTDPNGSRKITNAVKIMIPSHINTDWKALGKKTLKIGNTTDFTIACGVTKSTTRVRVTQSNEQ
jgi:hypothetical protein